MKPGNPSLSLTTAENAESAEKALREMRCLNFFSAFSASSAVPLRLGIESRLRVFFTMR